MLERLRQMVKSKELSRSTSGLIPAQYRKKMSFDAVVFSMLSQDNTVFSPSSS
jgi:hypothetical protein